MAEQQKKPWEKDGTEKPKNTGNPNWKPGMRSPNPAGRPKGIVDKRMKMRQMLDGKVEDVLAVVIKAALANDIQAASLVLSRAMPSLKSRDDHVQFDLNTKAPLAEQVEQVLSAMAGGDISPDTAKQVIETIGALGAVRQMEELEQRLAALEGQA